MVRVRQRLLQRAYLQNNTKRWETPEHAAIKRTGIIILCEFKYKATPLS